MKATKWWERPQSTILASIIALIALGTIGWFYHAQKQIDQANQRVVRQIKQTNRKLANVKEKTHDQLLKQGLASSNDHTRQSADQIVASDQLNLASTDLFKTLLTYDNQKTWLARTDKLKDLVTPEVLQDKKLFNSGLDDSGNSIIEALQLSSQFNSLTVDSSLKQGNEIDGLVHVQYTARSVKAQGGVRTKVYLVHYDLAQKKFSKIQGLGTENLQAENN
ncbi:hypothetical protein LMC02_10080 [Limosilactobacillus reuteri]|uniref:hypothetical protein n=1 Tax=Limosilactobacillus reuteri TaxID=1598 RepID=UPI001E321E0E|nr:hypothetical protein [Limosilactobacillus reuteri]MCC4500334.1 hypothetical protein [Limosilactobacillus reuteri]MCC4500659.1 hypothetical protein [Limosilactobacillus reuteri]